VITPDQCLEARRLLGWSCVRLGSRCDLSRTSLVLFEMGVWLPKPEGLATIQQAVNEAGVEFTTSGEPSMKLKKQG
jgi:hypothetical protein